MPLSKKLGAEIARGNDSHPLLGPLAANGFGEHSLGHYDLASAFATEVLMTAVFLFVIMGSTDKRAPAGGALGALVYRFVAGSKD